jgi:signal transduction histidine kinase
MRRLLDALYRVEGLLSGVSNLDTLLQTVIDESRRLAEAEASSLLLFNEGAGELYFHVALSEAGDPEALKKSVRLKLGEGIAGIAAATRASINVADAASDPRVHRAADTVTRFKTRSLLAAPMLDGERLIGVVEVLNKRGHGGFSGFDQRILEMFSALAAVAIARARLIEENLRAARLAAVGQAVAGISHHTKNILTALDASVEIVDAGLAQKNERLAREGWPVLKRSVGRLSHVVEDMLAFSKPRQPRCESCDIDALVRDTIESFNALMSKREIEVTVDTGGLRDPAWVDARGLHRALLNLLTNAADAVPAAGGRICVEARQDPAGNLELSVCDNGPGVPEAERVRIFDPFYSTKGSKGTGLGLAVTAKTMTEHGGSVSVEDGPLGGARFVLRAPPHRRET